jgi:hypothetical protein
MNLPRIAELLWVAGFAGHVALLAVLLIRQRWREFPVFTGYAVFQTVWSPILYAIYAHMHSRVGLYAHAYWSGALLDFVFQLAIVFEVARVVMKPTGTWLRDARQQFLLGGAFGVILAAALAWFVTPPGAHGWGRLEMKGDLFAAFLVCELFLVIGSTAQKLGLGWRNHVLSIGLGFTVWLVSAVLTETLHGYFGTFRYYYVLYYAQQFVYLGALGYWIVQLWLPEPERRPISAELRDYIVALHQRVEYDFGETHD